LFELAQRVTVGSVIDVKTRDAAKGARLKWHRAQVMRVETRGKQQRLVAVVVYTASEDRGEYDVDLQRKNLKWRLLSGGKTSST
jgi:hypothetical protein